MPDATAPTKTMTGMRAFATGVAIGAAVTLLCAPARGRETRAYLTRTARNGRERARQAARAGQAALVRQQQRFNDAVGLGRSRSAPTDEETEPGATR